MPIPPSLETLAAALAALILAAVLWRILRAALSLAAIAILLISLPDLLHGRIPAWAAEAGRWIVTFVTSLAHR